MEPDVVIEVAPTAEGDWFVRWDGLEDGGPEDYAYKSQATNHAREILHEASSMDLLAELRIYDRWGALQSVSRLGPGARANERKRGGRCVPTKKGPKLTPPQRRRLPRSAFLIPEDRSFPVVDGSGKPSRDHATMALVGLLRRRNTKSVARRVLAGVKKRFPGVYDCEQDLVESIRDEYGI